MANSTHIPARVDDITSDWLNEVLGDGFGTIASISVDHFGEGVGILGELARITLTYAPGESGPATVVAKCPAASEENHFLAIAMGFYVREVNFYREVADQVPVRVPRMFHADTTETGIPFVLVIEDIIGGYTPNQVDGISVEEAEKIISTIVPLHVQFWGDLAQLETFDWLPPMNNDMYKGGQQLGEALFPSFKEHYGAHMSASDMERIGVACERYTELLDYSTTVGAATFTHTDCRAENYLFGGPDGDDAVTVIDFQLSTRHIGMWDITNLIAGSMTTELRRAHERQLIQGYVEQIQSHGIDYSMDQAMKEYRVCLLHQCPAQVITSDLEGGNERGAELLEQLHLRPLHAAIDNNALDLLDEF